MIIYFFLLFIKIDHINSRDGTTIWWPIACVLYQTPAFDIPDINSTAANEIQQDYNAESDVKFFLYTKESRSSSEQLVLNNISSIFLSEFDIMNKIIFIIHGWRDNHTLPMTQLIKNAYLKNKELNIIAVDWSKGAENLIYPEVANNYVPPTAEVVAEFIIFLVEECNIPLDNIQLVGHSLGAQISGIAGYKVFSVINSKIPVIVGLDPALPYFENKQESDRLDASDAEYVEVIHTSAGCTGYNRQLGTADFYPNYSRYVRKQPGCGLDPNYACSHARAYYYFAESINTKILFMAKRCQNYRELAEATCFGILGLAEMGGGLPFDKDAEGIYSLKTKNKSPYAMG